MMNTSFNSYTNFNNYTINSTCQLSFKLICGSIGVCLRIETVYSHGRQSLPCNIEWDELDEFLDCLNIGIDEHVAFHVMEYDEELVVYNEPMEQNSEYTEFMFNDGLFSIPVNVVQELKTMLIYLKRINMYKNVIGGHYDNDD